MKKRFTNIFVAFVAFIAFALISTTQAYAGYVSPGSSQPPIASAKSDAIEAEAPVVKMEITSGVDLTKEGDIESTFNETRTISGLTENGTEVTIVVTHKLDSTEHEETGRYNFLVGATGLFSQTVDLSLGENTIKISADKTKYQTNTKTFIIKRKSRDIKLQLEQRIILPGDKVNSW